MNMNQLLSIKKVIWANRKTFCLKIDDNGDIIVVAPKKANLTDISRLIQKKSRWIQKTRKLINETKEFTKERKFVEGEIFFYLGEKYSLKYYNGEQIQLDGEKSLLLAPYSNIRNVKDKILEWYIVKAQTIFRKYLDRWSENMNIKYSKFSLTNAKTRWGSCNRNFVIKLNWRLIMMPTKAIEYIVVHELAHIIHPNHSKSFYNFVARFCPYYKESIKLLKKYEFVAKLYR